MIQWLFALLFTFVTLASQSASAQSGTPASRLSAKDITVHPYCTVAAGRKIDSKSKGVFDELRVVVTNDAQAARIRITGKKRTENETLEGQPVLHTGKLALVPFSELSGTIKAAEPTTSDVRGYYIVCEIPGDKLSFKGLDLKKGVEYQWTTTKANGKAVFTVTGEGKEIGSVSVSENDVKSFGIAAVVRWTGNESDISMTIQKPK